MTVDYSVSIRLTKAQQALMEASLGDGSNSDGLADECDDDRDQEYWFERELFLAETLTEKGVLEIRDPDDARLVATAFSTSAAFSAIDYWSPPLVASRSRVAYRLRATLEQSLGMTVGLPAELN